MTFEIEIERASQTGSPYQCATLFYDGSINEIVLTNAGEKQPANPSNRTKMCVRENGKTARTDWFVEEKFGDRAALVRCVLHTGRTHQIRVHLAHIGYPILGDKTYGKPHQIQLGWPTPRVMLHAARLRLTHPITGEELDLRAPLPPDFSNLAEFLRERFGSRIINRG